MYANQSLITVYRDAVPEGVGFSHFDLVHISMLVLIAALIFLIAKFYKRSTARGRRRWQILLAAFITIIEILKVTSVCISHGRYLWELLPLHLCGMSIIFIIIHTIKPNVFTGEFMYCLSIPGAVMALLFADWTMYPVYNLYALQSFFIHCAEIAYPAMLIYAGDYRPNVKRLWMPFLYLAATVAPIYFLNHALDTNFMFLNEAAPGSPLSFLQDILGSPGYIFGTVFILLPIWLIMYVPLYIHRWRVRKRTRLSVA